MSIAIDLVIVIVALIIIFSCYVSGLISSLIRLLGTIVAFALAFFLSAPVADFVYDNYAYDEMVQMVAENLPDLSALEVSTEGLPLNSQELNEIISHVMGEMGLEIPEDFVIPENLDEIAPSLDIQSNEEVAATIVDQVAKPIVHTAARVIAFVVLFIVFGILVKLLNFLGKQVNEIPLIGSVNKIGGVVVGVVEAAVFAYIASMALVIIVSITGGIGPLTSEVLDNTYICNFVSGTDFVAVFASII